ACQHREDRQPDRCRRRPERRRRHARPRRRPRCERWPVSVPFEIPDWLLDASASQAPPDTSGVDPHRVEDLVNRFIAAKQDALFTAPDAYYRTTGADAIQRLPYITNRLTDL